MRFLRLVAALLLIAVLPLQGWATFAEPQACMETMGARQQATDACCDAVEDGVGFSAKAGLEQSGSCQTDPACQTGAGSTCFLPAAVPPLLVPLAEVLSWQTPRLPAGISPPALWRPPRAL